MEWESKEDFKIKYLEIASNGIFQWIYGSCYECLCTGFDKNLVEWESKEDFKIKYLVITSNNIFQ